MIYNKQQLTATATATKTTKIISKINNFKCDCIKLT